MSGRDDNFELADRGDDRPGLEDLTDDLDDDFEQAEPADDEDDDFDELEEAGEEDVDFIAVMYREDGEPVARMLSVDLANDLEELIAELRRYPGDAGSLGVVSIGGEFFVFCRVRGRIVQVVLSDAVAANDWPIARDVVDYLGEETPDEEEDSAPVGDLAMLADLGCPEFDLEQFCLDYDTPADEVALAVANKIKMGEVLRKAVD